MRKLLDKHADAMFAVLACGSADDGAGEELKDELASLDAKSRKKVTGMLGMWKVCTVCPQMSALKCLPSTVCPQLLGNY